MFFPLKKTHKRFIKFCVVGLVGTAVHFGLLIFLVEKFAINEIWATSFAFISAVTTNFLLNKFWTFQQKGSLEGQFIRYFFVATIGLGFNDLIMYFGLHFLSLHYIPSQVIATILVAFWNFYGASRFVFYEAFEKKRFLIDENRDFEFAISIIIPAFNEADRIEKTLYSLRSYFEKKDWRTEIIVVDDYSSDQTVGLIHGIKDIPHLRCIRHNKNYGKGWAVKTGFLNAQGEIFLFMDADGSAHISEFEKFLPYLKSWPIIIGSRYIKGSDMEKSQNIARQFLSRWGNRIMRNLLKISIRDTQCGFKAFYCDTARFLAERQTIEEYAFDMELLAIASLHGIPIKEVGIKWHNDENTRVRFIRDALKTLCDLIQIKVNMERGYYQ